ncbi:MAG: leucyl aminopeptidase [Gammaproteobacteria bacterium]|nr:leucyl aminopeptidase [Gammaproteobacteria bacterium]|tara:strand:+ start:907 stop:2364 length:1458 start_codon:yes stop_codon:yes gene_type:complete
MKYFTINKLNQKSDVNYHILGMFSGKKLIKNIDDTAIQNNIKESLNNKEITGALGEYQIFHGNSKKNKLVLFGLGSKQDFDPISLQKSLTYVIKSLIKTNATSICLEVDNLVLQGKEPAIKNIIIAIETALYKYKKNKTSNLSKLNTCYLKTADKSVSAKFKETVKISTSISNGINKAKDLGNTPPNICTPTYLSDQAKQLQKKYRSLNVEILDEKKMESLKMGSLLSVSRGSKEPAKLVTIKYLPIKNKKPIILVGKGITFDTGGISIKPSGAMDEMKFDMSGAAAVLGTLQACAEMKIKTNVIGILACAENMPSSSATRPGDVVKSMEGISIEILNTDAEGRLVLCDALTYAKKFNPRYMIDLATLTGACLVALGKYPSGLFSNDQKLADLLKNSGDKTGDRVWQLPLYKEYFDELKTNFADIQNIGGRYGGAITAAAFLAKFTEGQKWAHLDIAGTAWDTGPNKGSTGRPVQLLTDFLLSNQ